MSEPGYSSNKMMEVVIKEEREDDHTTDDEVSICKSDPLEDIKFEESEDVPSDSDEEPCIKRSRISEDFVSPSAYFGRDNTKWDTEEPNQPTPIELTNIKIEAVDERATVKQIWERLLDPDIIDEIVTWTNMKLSEKKKNTLTDENEINAYISIVLLMSIYKSPLEGTKSLFSSGSTGRPIFRSIMSSKRFDVLSSCLQFDNPYDREIRAFTDKAAHISQIFEKFTTNCQKSYTIGDHTTVDDMLIPFRGQCPFLVLTRTDRVKHGIKIRALIDAKNSYFYDGFIYTGTSSNGAGLDAEALDFTIPTQAVLKVSKCIEGTGRNITANSYFSSIPLCEELLKRGLTFVGNLKEFKREIPAEFQANTERTMFGFNGDMTLLSYATKQNKPLIYLSSMHHTKSIECDTKKPEIHSFFNKTKGGIEFLDKTFAKCTRRTSRWPLAVFFRIVDICSSNCYILYQDCKNEKMTRFKFIEVLADELAKPHLEARLCVEVKKESVLVDVLPTDRMEKRSTCKMCQPKLRRKTMYKCICCSNPICLQCSTKICHSCAVITLPAK